MNSKLIAAACLTGALGLGGCANDQTTRGALRGAGFGAAGGAVAGALIPGLGVAEGAAIGGAGGAVVGGVTADNRRYYTDRRGREYYVENGRRIYRR